MFALTLLVASIAIADSINPSTIVPALWLAGTSRGRGLGSYTLGAFLVYLAGGLVLVLGPGPALIRTLRHVGGPLEHALLAAGGVAVIAFAFALWRSRRSERPEAGPRQAHTRASAFALGAGIMAVELPTAFVYFGAITAILADHTATGIEILLLVLYNALFVAPLVAILFVHRLAGDRAKRWLLRGGERLRDAGRVALTGVAGAGGTALVVVGVSGLLAP
jgi:cytochrome c biogenesis protein CcdA